MTSSLTAYNTPRVVQVQIKAMPHDFWSSFLILFQPIGVLGV